MIEPRCMCYCDEIRESAGSQCNRYQWVCLGQFFMESISFLGPFMSMERQKHEFVRVRAESPLWAAWLQRWRYLFNCNGWLQRPPVQQDDVRTYSASWGRMKAYRNVCRRKRARLSIPQFCIWVELFEMSANPCQTDCKRNGRRFSSSRSYELMVTCWLGVLWCCHG